MIITTSAIEWHKCSDKLPDDGLTVLVYVPGADEPVWLGYFEDDEWVAVCGTPCEPTHWAEVPAPEGAM